MSEWRKRPVANFDPSEGVVSYVENPIIVAKNITKRYVVSDGGESGDAKAMRGRRGANTVDALNGASFVVSRGESVGLVGLNGSGKSTMLRLIAGGEPPTTGEIYAASEPVLMGVSAALQPALTGRRNILIGLLAMGFSRRDADAMVPEIADWVDIGEGIDRPMATYSSGMGARLKFAISTAARPEILLIDEALSTGDVTFADKAQERMRETLSSAGSVFLVSHAIKQIEDNCTRAIWLHKGEIISDGECGPIAEMYHEWARLRKRQDNPTSDAYLAECKANYTQPEIYFDEVVDEGK